uniref:FLYWCH-type domain-containing protein n=1 Tax=Ascaris lumbricoides TaxID=6252 RepID=A0A0M3IA42_ASCLU
MNRHQVETGKFRCKLSGLQKRHFRHVHARKSTWMLGDDLNTSKDENANILARRQQKCSCLHTFIAIFGGCLLFR